MSNVNTPAIAGVSEAVFNGILGEVYERLGYLDSRLDDSERTIRDQAQQIAALRSAE